jgi:hypothetical protein
MIDDPHTPPDDPAHAPKTRPTPLGGQKAASALRAVSANRGGFPQAPHDTPRLKRGRPAVPEADARSKRVTVRLEPAEAASLTARSAQAGITESEFIRRAVNGAEVVTPSAPANFALVHELIAQGRNLNQIARAMNRREAMPPGTHDTLAKINALLDRLIEG